MIKNYYILSSQTENFFRVRMSCILRQGSQGRLKDLLELPVPLTRLKTEPSCFQCRRRLFLFYFGTFIWVDQYPVPSTPDWFVRLFVVIRLWILLFLLLLPLNRNKKKYPDALDLLTADTDLWCFFFDVGVWRNSWHPLVRVCRRKLNMKRTNIEYVLSGTSGKWLEDVYEPRP